MGESLLSSQSCANLEVGLPNSSPIESAPVCLSHNAKRVRQTGKTWLPSRLRSSNASKRRNLPSQGLHNSRFLKQVISCTETRQKMAASNRSQCSEQLFVCTNLQDGDLGNYQKFPDKRRVGSLHRSKRRVLSCSHTFGFSTLATLPCRQENVPVQGSAFRFSNSTTRVHADCKTSEARTSVSRNSSSPIPGRLVVKGKLPTPVHEPDKRTPSYGPGTRFRDKLRKIRARTYTKKRLSGLPFRFDTRKSLSNPKEVENSSKSCSRHGGRIANNPKVAYVPDRCTSIPRKNNTNGQAPYASVSVVPEDTLAISPVSRPEDSGFKSSKKLSSVVERSQKSRKGLSFTSSGTQYPYFHRCVKPGLGSSFRKSDSQWQLDRSGKIASYQCPRVEGGISGLKKLSKQNSRQEGSHSNRQRHCSQLSEQTRGNTLMGHVSPGLAHHGLLQSSKHTHKSQTHSGLPQCHSRQSLQEGQNNSDRVVTSSSNIHLNLPSLAQTNGRHVCHQDEPQTSTLCFSSPRCKCTEHRCIEHLVGGSGRLCLLSCSSHTKGHTENEHLQVQNDSSSTRVAHDALVLGSGEPVNQTSITTTSLASSVNTTIQSQVPSESVVSESSCLAPRHHSEPLESFSEQVADRIKAPQRPSSRRVYESRWSIFELWCQQSQVVSSEPTISKIADFLNYLFTVKNLKPATIAGYRTAIADHLGHFGQEVSKSLDLNRLIASFYRDKPTANRGIPSWDLSLVLSALTKAPFEPLKDASLKILTFKTVFLMALASGKRRGEVHSWTYSSLRHKPHWKEVTISPSPAFLAKNQLASDGPDLLRPVVIPALKPFLSSDLTEDMTLCPVRALRYYLDRTNELRRGKNLLFISFKEGFDKDIMRSTISSWIKQTVLLAYQSSKADSQDLHIKAHDIRSMSASLAFKGGASLEQILGSCYWKSHNTFTTFYLKDVAWQSHEQSDYKLGPVVPAQHIVNV